jgi:hypothetical protein
MTITARYCALAIFGLVSLSARAADNNYNSANEFLPGCQELIAHQLTFASGRCVGVIHGLAVLGQMSGLLCPPDGVTREQYVRIVVKFIESQPETMHEDFDVLALVALRRAFACKKPTPN